jgi:GntR family transcriptional regulator
MVACHYRMTSLPHSRIDRDSPVPFWFQLAGVIEHAISSGRWRPGERLPSESELCSHFEISRTTVRQALARLEQEGMVIRRKGFGTFVASASPRMWLVQSQEGFFQDEVFRLGRAVTSEILRREVTELPSWAAAALALPEGSQGVVMERLRSVDGRLALVVADCAGSRIAGPRSSPTSAGTARVAGRSSRRRSTRSSRRRLRSGAGRCAGRRSGWRAARPSCA